MVEEVVRHQFAPQRCECVEIQGVADEMIHVVAGVGAGVRAESSHLPGGAVGLVVRPEVMDVADVPRSEVHHVVVDEIHVPTRVG